MGSFTTRAFSYDAAGNLLTQVMGPLRLAFAYNQRNRPVSLTRTGDGTQTSNYLFNALEQLVQRRTNAPGGPAGTVQYLYGLDGELLAEADAATGQTLRDYIWLPQGDISPAADNDNEEGAEPPPLPLALVTGANTATPALLMVHADHLSRPVRLTDATRATVWQASYDPFGQPVAITGTVEQNLRFPGQYFLIESGMAYNWHRIYDPATGRYTQPDPLRFADGPSVYGYARQQPTQLTDPSGLQAEGVCAAGGPYNPVCDAVIAIDVFRACVLVGGLILEMARPTKKERATDIPSWVKQNYKKDPNEDCGQFAKSVMDQQYGPGWEADPARLTEYSQIKKACERGGANF